MRRRYLALLLLAACGGSKETKQLCEKAGARYLQCVGEILGPEMQKMAAGKPDNTAACAKDDKTVAMYRKCLPATTCSLFMDCMTDYAEATQPAIASDVPRAEQCRQHVADGMRSIANSIMMLGEIFRRSDLDKRDTQNCLLDESRDWRQCLTKAEVAEADRYATQRQLDCEGWEPALAACILRQPGATDCNEDEYPMWELPIEHGEPGPAVAWTAPITDDLADYDDNAHFAWTVAKALIVRDDGGLRALKDGAELWRVELGEDVEHAFALAGNWIVIRDDGTPKSLRVIDATTGKQHGRALVDVPLERHGAFGTKVLVQLDDDQLFELDPAKCRGDKGAGCAVRLGQLNPDDTVYTSHIAAVGDRIVMTSMSGIHVVDRKARTLHALSYENADDIYPTTEGAAVVFDSSISLFSFVGCAAGADCVTAKHRVSWIASVEPAALPNGGIAYNDHAVAEKTAVVEANGRAWSVETNARGSVAGDRDRIYTVSFGRNAKEGARLLALTRTRGETVWSTPLPGAAFDAKEASVTLRADMVAVRVDGKVYAINLATKT